MHFSFSSAPASVRDTEEFEDYEEENVVSKRTCHSELYEEENVPFRISNMSKRKRKFSFSEFESPTESRRVIDDAKSKSVGLTCATSDEFLAIMSLHDATVRR